MPCAGTSDSISIRTSIRGWVGALKVYISVREYVYVHQGQLRLDGSVGGECMGVLSRCRCGTISKLHYATDTDAKFLIPILCCGYRYYTADADAVLPNPTLYC